jgi:prepilin-type N-terminal cleavage/methylation domain-containing protein
MDRFPRANVASSDCGFSLVEVMVAMLVFVIGLTGVAQLLAISLAMHADAREATTGTQQAQGKLDELMKLNFSAPAVQLSGAESLSSNVADHFDVPAPSLLRRWRVENGPAAGTRLVTVRVTNARARQYGRRVDLTTVIRQW